MSKSLQYILGRGLSASTRLNFQHSIFKNHLGYLLHPKVELPKAPKIADIGTGTGIWPVEVLKTINSTTEGAQFHGFDVSKNQFPHPDLLPKGISLHEQDAFSAYPQDFVGRFDLVHVRAFVSILNQSNIDPFMRGVSSLLKPGGFLQWVDLNPANTEIAYIGRGPDPRPGHIQYAVDQYKALNGTQVLSQLDQHTNGHDLKLLAHETSRIGGFDLPLWFQNEAMALEDYYVRPAKGSGDPERIQRAEQTVASFIEEAQTGAYISPEIFTRVMQKV